MSGPVLDVSVVGVPAPQGSKRHVGGGIMIESSAAVMPWRDSVAIAVYAKVCELGWEPLDEATHVAIEFYLPRPPSVPKKRVKPDRLPDLDKLTRATLDALATAKAFTNDARVVTLDLDKSYARPNQATGARIIVQPWVNWEVAW